MSQLMSNLVVWFCSDEGAEKGEGATEKAAVRRRHGFLCTLECSSYRHDGGKASEGLMKDKSEGQAGGTGEEAYAACQNWVACLAI